MSYEEASRLNCKFALATKKVKITVPSGRDYRVMPGHIFLSSTSVAHAAALAGLCRAIDPTTDMDAPVEGDRRLFDRHGARFFDIPHDGAVLAVRIELFKEPAPPIIINAAAERPAASPPAPMITGFELPPH